MNKDLFQTDEKFYQNIALIQKVEGMALVMLCSCSHRTKNYAKHLLVVNLVYSLLTLIWVSFLSNSYFYTIKVMVKNMDGRKNALDGYNVWTLISYNLSFSLTTFRALRI